MHTIYPTTAHHLARRIKRSSLWFLLWCSAAMTMQAQLSTSALDYLLQRPKVAKHYTDKKFGDHLFVEGGFGINTTFSRTKNFPQLGSPQPEAGIRVGDWATPLHGWRVGAQAGKFKDGDVTTKTLTFSADYLLNLTALARPQYDIPRTWEWYGVAGIDANISHSAKSTLKSLGLHLGLRAQANLGGYTYIYLEPQLGVEGDNLYHKDSWQGYTFMGSVEAGLGYRLVPHQRKTLRDTTDGHFLNHCFVEFAGGPSLIANSSPSTWDGRMGVRAQVSFGKWWNPYSGLRLTGGIASYRQTPMERVKAVNLSVGYLLNMHNLFGGYDPSRRYHVNAVADATVGYSAAGSGYDAALGVGAGLQGHVRIGRGATFYIEPRVDVMRGRYAPDLTTTGDWDVAPSILAGFAFTQGTNTYSQIARNRNFRQESAYDHLFIDAGAGLTLPVSNNAYSHPRQHLDSRVFASMGKWWNATSGTRLWLEAAQYKVSGTNTYKTMGIGVDYLWNITNALHGYRPDRRFDLIAAVGINGSKRQKRQKIFFGGNAAVRGVWNINKMWGLYLEPQLRLYADNYLPGLSFPTLGMDLTSNLVAGIQVNLRDYVPSAGRDAYDSDERTTFVSVAGGTATGGNDFKVKSSYGVTGRLSYGRRFSPLSAWRFNVTGLERSVEGKKYARASLGADYLLDLTTLGMGYDTDHAVRLRALLGADIGVDYKQLSVCHMVGEAHMGAQLGFRAGRRTEVYVEPQAAYIIGGGHYPSRSARIEPRGYLGLNYSMYSGGKSARQTPAPERKRFVSLAIGTGAHTSTVESMSPVRRKFTLDFSAYYGSWWNALSGYRAGISTTTVQVHGKGNYQHTALHADYMFNLLTLSGGGKRLDSNWLLNGYTGASLYFASRPGHSVRVVPGMNMSLQVGRCIDKTWQVFLEPTFSVTSKNICPGSSRRPAEGQIGLQLGAAYRF